MNSGTVNLMKLLLDTHVFLWLRSEPEKVSSKALNLYQEPNNSVYLSIVSVWEMQIKRQIGKLDLNMPLQEIIEEQCETNNLQILPLRLKHIFGLQDLPLHHKDPFDRLLLVQSQIENLYLISSDSTLKLYQVNLCW
jgi:PIN domain nuclease of toxin-antitoxin system